MYAGDLNWLALASVFLPSVLASTSFICLLLSPSSFRFTARSVFVLLTLLFTPHH